MIAASRPSSVLPGAKLLVVDRSGPGATPGRAGTSSSCSGRVISSSPTTPRHLPASLVGRHVPTGRRIEVRLAGRESLEVDAVRRFSAVLFGLGDFRMRTEDRPPPPPCILAIGWHSARCGQPFSVGCTIIRGWSCSSSTDLRRHLGRARAPRQVRFSTRTLRCRSSSGTRGLPLPVRPSRSSRRRRASPSTGARSRR